MSRFLPHIASRLLNVPLMITPEGLAAILRALGPRIGLAPSDEIPRPAAVTDFSRSPRYREYTGDGIGLIPVMGPLAYNVSIEDALCGGVTSYHDIRDMFREAIADPLITSVLFAFDSPGGEVAGVFDLADEIYAGRGVKPIYAAIDESAFSAAYALASSADRIFIPRTGGAGSIGVIAQFVDQSGYDAKEGLKYTAVYAGARKNDFNPHEPLSGDARATLQALVDEDYRIFVETVARNRGLTTDAVASTEAGIFQGEAAIGAGLADTLANFQQAVSIIEGDSRNGGSTMRIFGFRAKVAPEATTPTDAPAAMPEEVVDLQAVVEQARSEGREQGRLEMEEAVRQAAETAVAEERGRVSAILNQCAAVAAHLSSPLSLASQLISEGVPAQVASDRIIRAVADQSAREAPEVISTVSPTGTGEPNPLLAEARRRAEAAKKKGA